MESVLSVIAIIIGTISCILLLVVMVLVQQSRRASSDNQSAQIEKIVRETLEKNNATLQAQWRAELGQLRTEINAATAQTITQFGSGMREEQANLRQMLETRLESNANQMTQLRGETLQALEKQRVENAASLDKINVTVNEKLQKTLSEQEKMLFNQLKANTEQMTQLRAETMQALEMQRKENATSLEKINGTVNEKLQKTLNDRISQSFELVNQRLEAVNQGLGEMKNVAGGVNDLRRVLSNVKARGILGEIQLGSILREILAPEQYDEQVPVVAGASERVDYAVKFPGTDGETVLLPIDSKFPADRYESLLAAYDSGDVEAITRARAELATQIKIQAKSIHDKYIRPPYTTNFAIMFLPFEGLYAEVVNLGLIEELQTQYQINITGPSTMAAMLNSLQMGFQTLAIQQKSDEVWRILAEARKEFDSFADVLDKARKHLQQADNDLENLIGRRTRGIQRKLKDVGSSDDVTMIEYEEDK